MLTKSHLIFVLLIVVAFLLISLSDSCDGVNRLKQDYKKIDSLLKSNDKLLVEQTRISALRRDSIEYWKNKVDTIIIEVEKYRKKSSGKIKEAKSVTEDTAKAKVWERFDNYKEIHTFTAISDSIKLELRGITEINKAMQQELLQSSKMLTSQDSTITLMSEQIELKDKTISLKNTEIEQLKKKQPRIFLTGAAIGIGIGAIGVLILVL